MAETLTFGLKALTDVWTGGVDQHCDSLHETGLLGSLRWWYEVVVRGLGGSACDPTDNSPCRDTDHCGACEVFGSTGWSRKIRLQVFGTSGGLISSPLNKGVEFALHFIELRHICDEERWLLTKSVEIAAKWGSIGGRTTRKPQVRKGVGDDYGLVFLKSALTIKCNQDKAKQYLSGFRTDVGKAGYPDLRCFFFVRGAFLWRDQMNALMAREPFLRGDRGSGNTPAVSKKIFSFQTDSGRVWGYAQDVKMRDEITKYLRTEFGAKARIRTGEEVIREF